MSRLWFVSLNSISPSPDPSISVSLRLTHPYQHTLFLSPPQLVSLQLIFTSIILFLSFSPPMSEWTRGWASECGRAGIAADALLVINKSFIHSQEMHLSPGGWSSSQTHRKWVLGWQPILLFQGFVRSQSSWAWSVNGSVALLLSTPKYQQQLDSVGVWPGWELQVITT